MSIKLKQKIKALISEDSEQIADISALEAAIGDEETEGTILYRIKALEDAQPAGES